MPTKPQDSIALEELIFPDDVRENWVFKVLTAQGAVHDAEEVREEIEEEHPQHGWWLHVELGGQGEKFLNAPEELRQELASQEAVQGDHFEITRFEKVAEHRIEVNLEPVDPEERENW